MARITVALGIVLVILGLVAYLFLGGETRSVTALIPAFFGAPLAVLGVLAGRPASRRPAMHIAAVLGVLGVAGTFDGLIKLPTLLSGGEVARPNAVAVKAIMALLCLVFVVLCIRSFVLARRGATPS